MSDLSVYPDSDSRKSDPEDYQYSEQNTPIKQEAYRHVLRVNMAILRAIRNKAIQQGWTQQPHFFHADFHSGPGIDPTGKPGSPLIFAEEKTKFGLPHKVHLFEKNPITFAQLKRNTVHLSPEFFLMHETDYSTILDYLPDSEDKQLYGTLYLDPSNAFKAVLPVNLLNQIISLCPKLEIIIWIAAATFKRIRTGAPSPERLALRSQMKMINKKHWFVRQPYGIHQWTMLVFTDWDEYPGKDDSFFDAKTEEGDYLLDRLSSTKAEREMHQLSLFGDK